MAFTVVTVTNDYDLPDGIDPVGTVSFTPSEPMVNGTTVVAAPVVRRLNIDGLLLIDVVANTDPATVPADTRYRVVEEIEGVLRSYYVVIRHDAGATVDLSSLDKIFDAPPVEEVGVDEAVVLPQWATLLAGKQPLAERLTRLAAAPVSVTYAASITLNASLSCVHRVTATGNLTLTDITQGIDGQSVHLEVYASGADRTVTISGVGTIPVPSGTWWSATFRFNATDSAWLYV